MRGLAGPDASSSSSEEDEEELGSDVEAQLAEEGDSMEVWLLLGDTMQPACECMGWPCEGDCPGVGCSQEPVT